MDLQTLTDAELRNWKYDPRAAKEVLRRYAESQLVDASFVAREIAKARANFEKIRDSFAPFSEEIDELLSRAGQADVKMKLRGLRNRLSDTIAVVGAVYTPSDDGDRS